MSTSRSMRPIPSARGSARAARDRGRCRSARSRPRSARARRRPARRRTPRRPTSPGRVAPATTGAPTPTPTGTATADRERAPRPRRARASPHAGVEHERAAPSAVHAGEQRRARRIRRPREPTARAAREAPCATSAIHDAGTHASLQARDPDRGQHGQRRGSRPVRGRSPTGAAGAASRFAGTP